MENHRSVPHVHMKPTQKIIKCRSLGKENGKNLPGSMQGYKRLLSQSSALDLPDRLVHADLVGMI